MKKQTKTILILLVVLVVLIGGVLCVTMIDLGQDEVGTVIQSEDYTVLYEVKEEDLTEISFTAKDAETITLKKAGDGWVLESDPKMPLDETAVNAIVKSVIDVRKYMQIETKEDFGFESEGIEVTVKTAEESFFFTIGSKNDMAGKAYLLTDSSEIFTTKTSLRNSFEVKTQDLLAIDEMPAIDAGAITSLAVDNGENSYEIAEYEDRVGYYWFTYMLENAQGLTPVDPSKTESLLTAAADPTLDCVNYAPSAAELTAAGFDESVCVTMTYTETTETGEAQTKTYQIFLGNAYSDENGDHRYVMIEGSDMLFSAEEATVGQLLMPDLSSIAPGYLAQMIFTEMQKFSFTIDGESHTITRDVGETETICYYDGKEAPDSYLESFYLDLTLLASEGGYTEELPASKPIISAAFTMDHGNGPVDYELSIYEYNENFCIAAFSGRQDVMLVSVRDVKALSNSFAEMKQNLGR